MIRLTIFRTDGPSLAGVYRWDEVLLRLEYVKKLKNFAGFTMEPA